MNQILCATLVGLGCITEGGVISYDSNIITGGLVLDILVQEVL
jgi:hypothetical protein